MGKQLQSAMHKVNGLHVKGRGDMPLHVTASHAW